MLDHLRQRVIDALAQTHSIVLASYGPAGLQVSICPCEARDTRLFLLVPKTSEHLVNLEHDPHVVVTTESWQLRGSAALLQPAVTLPALSLVRSAHIRWSEVLELRPTRFEFIQKEGWGSSETIDLT